MIVIGVVLVVVGFVIYFFHDKFNWIGRLPGDIRVERENFRFYFPITTMILLSIVLTILLRIWRKFF